MGYSAKHGAFIEDEAGIDEPVVIRDMDLVRKILLEVEKQPYTGAPFPIEIEGYDHAAVNYHARALIKAGLLDGVVRGKSNRLPQEALVVGLTWDGHEFLDNAFDDSRWEAAKRKAGLMGRFSLEALSKILLEMAVKAALSA